MTLDSLQTKLVTILQGMALFSAVTASIVAEDGQQVTVMETALDTTGIAILVDQPRTADHVEGMRGAADANYLIDIYLRTNPKVHDNSGAAKWNPLILEEAIINAVIGTEATQSVFRFRLSGARFFWEDVGNNSRLITFWTPKVFTA